MLFPCFLCNASDTACSAGYYSNTSKTACQVPTRRRTIILFYNYIFKIFLSLNANQEETINSIHIMYAITNVILLLAIIFFVIQLYWGVTNQLQNDNVHDDCKTKESYYDNQDLIRTETIEIYTGYESLTKENTSFNTYLGLNSWILNEELDNIIEEKNLNITFFQNKYSNKSKLNTVPSFGPHLWNLKWKWRQADITEINCDDQLKLNISGVLSTDASENWTSPNVNNISITKQKRKADKRVRFDF